MIPWELIDTAPVPGGDGELRLFRRGDELSIVVRGGELMNSRVHGSEDALAELGCARAALTEDARVLVGGLGMGYTLAAALRQVGPSAQVTVAELMSAVVHWNRGPLAPLAGCPLDDPRVRVHEGDVAMLLKAPGDGFDAILLDVDNGPEGLVRRDNDWLYGAVGLEAAFAALRPAGLLAVWSAGPEPAFADRLRYIGFDVAEHRVRAHAGRKGARHTIWIAARPG